MLSFSSYFLAKILEKRDFCFFLEEVEVVSSDLFFSYFTTVSDFFTSSDFVVDFVTSSSVTGSVDFSLFDLLGLFDFLVAIFPPLIIIFTIIAQKCML
jgi:hypothetical protein